MDEVYRSGLRWLATSGIQAESGGVSRYYSADRDLYRNLSTEITAYGVQGYLYLPLPGQTAFLSNALRGGQFLCYDATRPDEGLFPYEISLNRGPAAAKAYFFDCGIVIRALLGLWNTTADAAYLERAERCGAALMDRLSRVDGSFFPVIDLSSGVPSASPENWSLEPGPYQLKVGLAFLELAEVTSSGLFSKVSERLLANALRTHEAFLPGHTETDRVVDRLHAYCYFLEGLLPFLERHFECVLILQGGISKVERMMAEAREGLERCDVLAQLLRLRLLADCAGVVELDVSAASTEAESLPAFQLKTDDRRTNGAFAFGRRNGELLPQANPTATIFALQALRMWHEQQSGELKATWRDLI